MRAIVLKQQRSEFGKQVRKAYESGCREFGGRQAMKELTPKENGKSETITTVVKDNIILEIYDSRTSN